MRVLGAAGDDGGSCGVAPCAGGGNGGSTGDSDPQLPGATKTAAEASGGPHDSGSTGPASSRAASTAATVSTRPPPIAQESRVPTEEPVPINDSRSNSCPAEGAASRIRAIAPAACGAAAEVPQKRHTPAERDAKKVVRPQSVAATSGLVRNSGSASGLAGVGPLTPPK